MIDSLLNPQLWAPVAALAHALLGAYVLLAGGGAVLRSHLLLVSLAGIVWGVAIAQPASISLAGAPALPALLGTGVLLAAWSALVHRALRGPYGQSMPDVIRRVLRLFWMITATALVGSVWLAREGVVPWFGTFQQGALLAVALALFALAAHLIKDAPLEGRTALRALMAGVTLAAGSQTVLLTFGLLAPEGVRALLGPAALAVGMSALALLFVLRVRPQWSLATFVSPEARSYAPRFLASGCYLLLVLLLLPAFRPLPASAAGRFTALMVAVTGALVLVVLFSQRLNARLRVFVSKHFLPFRYDYREEWLRLIDTLVSKESGAPLPERVIRAVAQIVGSPAGVLWMRNAETGPFVVVAGWNTRVWSDARVAPDDPAVLFMLQRQWIIDTAELTRRPELYGDLRRPDWLEPFPDALLIVPLIGNEDLIGFMVLLQSSSAFRLTFEEIDLLRTSGRQVAAFLAQYEADQKLAESKQFEAFNRLTAFVMHDLKNLIAQQSLMVRNAARHKGNPAFFEDAIATIDNSVARMSKLLQQLQSGDTAGPRQRVRLASAVRDAVERCRGREPVPVVDETTTDVHVWIDRERLTAVIAHLVRNAQEATSADGRVTITIDSTGPMARITIEDDGCGMDEEFIRQRLFRPFDTTKGSKGMGIGAYQARTFVDEAGGGLRVDSAPGQGTRLVIELPTEEPVTEKPVA